MHMPSYENTEALQSAAAECYNFVRMGDGVRREGLIIDAGETI